MTDPSFINVSPIYHLQEHKWLLNLDTIVFLAQQSIPATTGPSGEAIATTSVCL